MIAELLTLKDLLPDNESSMRVNGTSPAPVQDKPKPQDKFISGVKSFIRGLRR